MSIIRNVSSLTIILLAACGVAMCTTIDSLKAELQTNVPEKQISIYYQIAAKFELSDPDSAFAYYQKGLNIAQSLNNDTLAAKGYNNIGYIYFNKGTYNDAINYLFKALKIFENNNLSNSTVQCLQYIGIAYQQLGMYDKAMNYAKQALNITEGSDNKYAIGINQTLIGSIYYSKHEYDMALDYFQQALGTMEEAEDPQGIADALNNVALIYEKKEDFGKALEIYLRSLKMTKELKDKKGVAATYHNISLVHKSMEQYPTAITYLDSCILLSKAIGNKFYLKESYHTLSEIYAQTGKYNLAYTNRLLFSELKDSLFNQESTRQFAEMSTKYESEKKDHAILMLNKEREIQKAKVSQARLLRNVFIVGFLVVLLFAFVIFKQRNKIRNAKILSDELLLNILPETVAEELKANGKAEAKLIDEVTVLFTDFKSFTAIAEQLTPTELVHDLNVCFSEFDLIAEKYGLEKIKTVGDSYMAAGGIPTPNSTHATDVIKAAFEMRQFIEEGKAEKIAEGKPYFEMRIGVHTGPVVAGIVGIKKFAYDIWGDAVNIASRMESGGEVGKINVSENTYQIVKDQFDFEYRGEIAAKGKGNVKMYFAEERKA